MTLPLSKIAWFRPISQLSPWPLRDRGRRDRLAAPYAVVMCIIRRERARVASAVIAGRYWPQATNSWYTGGCLPTAAT